VKRRAALKTGLAFGAGVLILRRAEAQGATLNLYSARHYNTDEALYGNFADLSGVKINRIDAEPDPLVERLKAEGDKSPCDVFITTDAGRIERARQMGLLQPVTSEVLTKSVPAHLRDPDGNWFGFSKRARVIMYNKEKVSAADAPKTYEDLADPKWKGKLLIRASGHIYNQSLVGSLLAANGPGEDRRVGQERRREPGAAAARRRHRPDQGRRRGRGRDLRQQHLLLRQPHALQEAR
jgi:iron(III) transport system substrate-binding protein